MKKKLLLTMVISIMASQCFSFSLAASRNYTSSVGVAIKKYKAGNYTGCLQDTQQIVKSDPSNALAHYYMAMSYVKAGKNNEAINAYTKVLSLHPNTVLYNYASTGKLCLEAPDKCKPAEQLSDIDKLISSPSSGALSNSVKDQIELKHLQMIKNEMNKDTEINNYKLKQFKDYTNQRGEVEDNKTVAEEKMPTNDEIVSALKVLNKAGLSQYSPANTAVSPYMQAANPMMMPQSAESMQMNMLLGSQNQPGNNNNMLNMIPFMLAQSKSGQSGNENPYTPQLMQSMLMNSMLPDFNFNVNDNKY